MRMLGMILSTMWIRPGCVEIGRCTFIVLGQFIENGKLSLLLKTFHDARLYLYFMEICKVAAISGWAVLLAQPLIILIIWGLAHIYHCLCGQECRKTGDAMRLITKRKSMAFVSIIIVILLSLMAFFYISNDNPMPRTLWIIDNEIPGHLDSKILPLANQNMLVILNLAADPESQEIDWVYRGNIQALDMDTGDERWVVELTMPTLSILFHDPVINIQDVEGGILVRFFSTLYYLDYEGEIIWEHYHCVSPSVETVVDLDNDGKHEIVVGTLSDNYETIQILRATTGDIIHSLEGNFTGFNPFGEVILHDISDGPNLVYVSLKGDIISWNIEKNEICWTYPQTHVSRIVKQFPKFHTDAINEITLWSWASENVHLRILDVDTGIIKRQFNLSDEFLLSPIGKYFIDDDNTPDYVLIQSTLNEDVYNIVALGGEELDTIWTVNNVSLTGVVSFSEYALAILIDDDVMYVDISTGNNMIVNIDSTVIDVYVVDNNSNRKRLFYISENEIGACSFYWEG